MFITFATSCILDSVCEATVLALALLMMAVATMNNASTIFPQGGWDVHHHVYDPSQFSYSDDRHMTPPAATISQFQAFKRSIGTTHSVLTHGLSYGSDCNSLLAFLNELGNTNTKGIGVIDPDTTPDDFITRMHAAGVRGIRVNLYKYHAMHDLELQKVALREHARRIIRFPGWSMTFTHVHPEFWASLRPTIEQELVPRKIRLVTDHFALLKGSSMLPPEYAGDATKQPGFADIVSLVRDGLLWIKLSAPYRVSEASPDYEDLKPIVRALVEANPRRVLWGSDWPHTPRMKDRSHDEAMAEVPFLEIDDVAWLKSLRSWLSAEDWELMVLTNPRELYDW